MKIIPAILAHSQEVFDSQLTRARQVSSVIQVDVTDKSYSRHPTPKLNIPKSNQHHRLIFHLMLARPEKKLRKYLSYSPEKFIVNAESVRDWAKLKSILQPEQLGIAINPHSSISILKPHIADAGEIVVMTVEPGDSGRTFQPAALKKIKDLLKFNIIISVDGGIDPETIKHARREGAGVAYVGSALMGKANIVEALDELKKGINANKRQ